MSLLKPRLSGRGDFTLKAFLLLPVLASVLVLNMEDVQQPAPTSESTAPVQILEDNDLSFPQLVEAYVEAAQDPNVEVTPEGVLITEPAPIQGAAENLPSSQALPPASSAFNLSSNPSASLTIYLDYTGHTTTGTSWNTSTGNSTILSAPWSIDSDTANFSVPERERIIAAWAAISADFSPYQVNVTTKEPPVSDLQRSSLSDTRYGTRVVISPSFEWYADVGGVAYLYSFLWATDTPAFVFASSLSGSKFVAEAVSHEVGHTLGLYHDGVEDGPGYYFGAGDWAPIMGVGYYRDVTQWSKGEYLDADNQEDDLDKIGRIIPLAETPGSSTTLSASQTLVGNIVTSGETDTYVTQVGPGNLNISVFPTRDQSNLVTSATLTGPGVDVTLTASSASAWNHTFNQPVSGGTYTLSVTGTGFDSDLTSFSDYGSLGSYTVQNLSSEPSPVPSTVTVTTGDVDIVTTTTSPPATTTTTSPPTTTTDPPPSSAVGLQFVPSQPTRVIDTRFNNGIAGRLQPRKHHTFSLSGTVVPDAAKAVVMTVTAVNPAAAAHLSVTPCDSSAAPQTSTLNIGARETVANSTITRISANRTICFYSIAETDLVVDVTGWMAETGGLSLTSRSPVRVADSREAFGISGKVPARTVAVLDLAPFVESDAQAAALNVTAVNAESAGHLSLYPCDDRPDQLTSAVNYIPVFARANNLLVKISKTQKLCIYTPSTVHVVVDIVGEFRPGIGARFVESNPVRLVDTRESNNSLGAFAGATYVIPEPPEGKIVAGSVNLVSVSSQGNGFLTTWDCGIMRETSSLNYQAGRTTANGAIVPVNIFGNSCIYTLAPSELVIDFAGWWVSS